MPVPPKALTPAEVLIDAFIKDKHLPPTCRTDLLGRFRDLLGVVEESVGWDLMEKTLMDDSDQGMSHLRQPDRILVPFELASAAFGANPTMKARGVLRQKVGQEVYDLTFKAWGATLENLPHGKLRPGVPPKTDDDERVALEKPTKKVDDGKAAGPFSSSYRGTDQERALSIAALIKSLGTAPVAAMARN